MGMKVTLPATFRLSAHHRPGFNTIQRKLFFSTNRTGNLPKPLSAAKDSMAKDKQDTPTLSPAEFRQYNRMAEQMEGFHNHFRLTWNELYTACSRNKRPSGQSIRQFITMGLGFCSQLGFHHSIEEQHIFPVLAKKMPEFRKELELLTQHKQIHVGLDKLEEYLEQCLSGQTELRLNEMKELMDSFGEVLWKHLDDEVQALRADNMRKYWTLDEMRRIPM